MSLFRKDNPLKKLQENIDELDASLKSAAKGLSDNKYTGDATFKELIKDAISTRKVKGLIPKYNALKETPKELIAQLDSDYKSKFSQIMLGMELFINSL